MTDLELLSNRLRRIENQTRWLKRALITVGVFAVAGAVMAQQAPQDLNRLDPLRTIRRPDQRVEANRVPVEAEVRAQHFVLVDTNGKERASLVADSAGSVFLVLFDARQKTRVQLSVGNEGPSLTFHDPGGQARTILGSTSTVASHVNDSGVAERSPASSIVLFDRTGKLLWRTP